MSVIKHKREDYPDWRKLPSQTDRIDERDWDVLVVFDACRWDFLYEILDGFDDDVGKPEMVKTPAEQATPDWTTRTWDREGWEDLTYLSANPYTSYAKYVDRFGVDLGERVDTYVEVWEDHNDDLLGCVRPDDMTEIALDHEPPMVVHYLQPHIPYIGDIAVRARTGSDSPFIPDHPLDDVDAPMGDTKKGGPANIYRLIEAGEISPSTIRHAYWENVKLVWRESRPVREQFDNVVVTADHGEALGPDRFDHGGAGDPRGRIVPWLEID